MIKAVFFDFNEVIYTDDYDQELLDLIETLKKKYKIGMITNYSEDGYKKYVEPIQDLFDDVLVSSRIGIHKPDPRIYQLAAKNLGVKPSECVYIDNHDFRVDGAVQAGMHGIIYENFSQMKAQLDKLLMPNTNN